MQALQTYFQTVIMAKDFLYFIHGLMFVTSHLYLRYEHHWSIIFSNFILFFPRLLESFFDKFIS